MFTNFTEKFRKIFAESFWIENYVRENELRMNKMRETIKEKDDYLVSLQEKYDDKFAMYLYKVDFEDGCKLLTKNEEFFKLKNEVGKLAKADEVRVQMSQLGNKVQDL